MQSTPLHPSKGALSDDMRQSLEAGESEWEDVFAEKSESSFLPGTPPSKRVSLWTEFY